MTGRLLTPFVVALVLGSASAQAAPKPAVPSSIDVALHCEACTSEQHPSVGLLWRAEAKGDEPGSAGIETLDWPSGRFALVSPSGARSEMLGQPLADGSGWMLSLPVAGTEAPFRVVAALEGFALDRSAWWPEREAGPSAFAFEPVPQVLEANPSWDPDRTSECDVLVPKTAMTPVTFFVQGQPRAWLYPAQPAADGTAQWTFQFVRPGRGLLERVNVLVPAFDEGGAWSFRLPLDGVLAEGATYPAASGGYEPAAPGDAVDEIRIAGAGTIFLSDCPRATR